MVHGSSILRAGLGTVFLCFAILQTKNPQEFASYLPHVLQGTTSTTAVYLSAAINGFFAVTIFFSLLPRISPILASAHLLITALVAGWGAVAVRDFGLAMACLSLAFIHEEHIPTRMRNVMARLFTKR